LLADVFTTCSGRDVAVHLYVEHGMANQAQFALNSIKQAMVWDEKAFDREYDLDIFMVVAVSDFNYGAMENKGLNIFNTKYILASPLTATDQDYIHVQGVIGHEYFHNWSGNRVTCRDWFQISLKEGLTVFRDQSFTMDMFSAGVKRIEDANIMQSMQFSQDSGPMAHPIRPESYIEVSNFYTVTVYNKGAEVIRMIQTLLGDDAFKLALNAYFERHDGQAVTTDDFVKVMEDSSGVDLSQFRLWYSQAGTPELTVSDSYNEADSTYKLTIEQFCPDTPGQQNKKPMVIPVRLALFSESGQKLSCKDSLEGALDSEQVCKITKDAQTFTFYGVPEQPTPSMLRGFSAPVKCDYAYNNSQLKALLAHDDDPFAAWEAGQQLMSKTIMSLVEDYQNDHELTITSDLSEVLSSLLTRDDLDGYFCADLITLPSLSCLAEQMEIIDVSALLAARKFLLAQLSHDLYDACKLVYESLCAEINQYEPVFSQMSKRRLANRCLAYMVHTENTEAYDLCLSRYNEADNLTDRLGALIAVNHHPCELRDSLLAQFYKDALGQDLVLDRWFMLQAASDCKDTLATVKSLVAHESFCLENPNRVRALLGTFSRNMSALHDDTGAGYEFLLAQILAVDARNPQVAARLFEPMLHWRKYSLQTNKRMHDALKVLEDVKLSKDVYELVNKALA
jgi:aminopeptidase N